METKSIVIYVVAPILGAVGLGFLVAGYMGFLAGDREVKLMRFLVRPTEIDDDLYHRWPIYSAIGLVLLLLTYFLATS